MRTVFVLFLVKFIFDVVVIVRRGLEAGKFSVANFSFVRTKLSATFRLFILSLQTPMYETDKNRNLRMQNAIGNQTSAAPLYEENPNQLHTQVHIVKNPMPFSSNLSGNLGNGPNVVYSLALFLPALLLLLKETLQVLQAPLTVLMERLLILLTVAIFRTILEMIHPLHLVYLWFLEKTIKRKI